LITLAAGNGSGAAMRELAIRAGRLSSAMQDAKTYRGYAEECATLARSMREHRAKLMDMAAAWNALAEAAERRSRTDAVRELD
jgi:hypothetical protein